MSAKACRGSTGKARVPLRAVIQASVVLSAMKGSGATNDDVMTHERLQSGSLRL